MWVLFAFLAVAAASPSLLHQETSIRPGKEYTFGYITQVLSGVSVDNVQYTGLKVKAQAKLQTRDGQKVNCMLTDVTILKLNREIPNWHPGDLVPDRVWTPVNGPERDVLTTEIRKPFSFTMTTGKFVDLETETDDPYWSVNVKRGFLSFMQLDLTEQERVRVDPEELRILNKLNLVTPQLASRNKTYRVMEEDVTGKCESVYSVDDTVERSSAPSIKVTKVKNFDNCIKRPIFKSGLMENLVFGSEYNEKLVTKWQMEADYELQGDRTNFLIKGAKLVSKQHFTKMELEKGKLLTFTVQVLTLNDVEEIRVPLRLSSSVERKDSLIMEVPDPIITERQPESRSIQSPEVRAKINLMEELLSVIIEETTPIVKENATTPMAELSLLMKEMPLTAVESLIEKYCTTSEITAKGEILLNTMATCTRPDIVPVIVKLLTSNIISDTRGSIMMKFISLYTTSTPMLAYDLMQAVKTGLPSHAVSTQTSALLTAGSVTHKLLRKMDTPAGRIAQVETILDRIATEMTTLLRTATTTQKKILVLKAMGNAGIPELITTLKTVITDTSEPTKVRVKAMYALRRVAPIVPTQVQDIVIPIYRNTRLPVDMRVAAFIVTMQTRPSLGIMKLITQQLKREPSLHVGSFVYSCLKDLSELKTPVLSNMTTTLKSALKYVRPFTPGFQYSKAIIKDYYSDYWKSGAIQSFEYLNKRNSFIPDTIIYRNDYDFLGLPFGGYELGLDMEGLQTLVKNVVGPKSMLKELLTGRLSLKDILEPIQYPSPSMLLHIRSIMEKISVTERELQNFDASIYFKMYDMELGEFLFDSRTLESLVQLAIRTGPEIIRKLERGIQLKTTQALPIIETSLTIPTPCGLPLSMNMTGNILLGIDSTTTVENMPSVRDILSLVGSGSRSTKDKNWRSSRIPEMKAVVTCRPSFLMDTNITVGVELALLRTQLTQFSKTYVTYPVEAEVKMEPETGILKTKLKTPEREEDVLKLTSLTTTSIVTKPTTPDRRWSFFEKTVEFPTVGRTVTLHHTIPVPFFGTELEIYREKTVLTRPSTLTASILAKKIISASVKPTRDTPQEISLETLYLGPGDADRSADLVHDILDIETDKSSSSSEEKDEDDDSWWWAPSLSFRGQRSSRDRSSTTPFTRVQVDPSIRNPVKHRFITVLKTHVHGSRVPEKKIRIQVSHVLSEDLSKHQHDIQIVYSPLLESSSQEKKIAVSSKWHLDTISKWLVEGHIPRSSVKDLLNQLEIYYGPVGYTQKYLDIETRLGRGAPLSWSQVHSSRIYTTPVSAPLELSLDIDYSTLPRPLIRYAHKIKDVIKVLPYITSSVTVDSEEARNTPNKIKLVAEFLTNQTEVQLWLETPTETNVIKGLPIPFLPRRDAVCSLSDVGCHDKWLPRDVELWDRSDRSPAWSLFHYYSGGNLPGKCELYRDDIETYDKKHLELPETDCEIILAEDCSSSLSPEFMVTMKKEKKDETKKTIHIYLPEHKIKIKPESGWFSKGINIEVNDRSVSVPESGESIPVYRYETGSRSERVCDIKKEDDKIVVICPRSGIKVKSDGIDVSIEPSSSYHNQLCGVCSNYNSEPMDDLMGPRNEIYTKPGPFILSYIMSEPRCNTEEVRERLLRRIPIPILGASRSECRKEMKTVKYERTVRKDRQTCFSVLPVPKCVGSCAEPSETYESIALHCVSTKNSTLPSLLDKLKRNEVLQLEDAKVDWHKEVKVPEMCHPAKPRN